MPRKNQEERRSECEKDTALPMNAHAPANAGGRQRERNRQESTFDTFVRQETDTKKRKDRRSKRGQSRYGTGEGKRCSKPIDATEFGWMTVH